MNTRAFTLIELLVVLSIITVLGLMAVPGVSRAISRGAINRAADDIVTVAFHAQQMAKRTPAPAAARAGQPHWGIAIVPDGDRIYATVVHGTATTDEWLVDGVPAFRRELPAGMEVHADLGAGLQPLGARLGWFYQYDTGWPIQSPTLQKAVSVGTPAQAAIEEEFVAPDDWTLLDMKNFRQYISAIPASPVCRGLRVQRGNGRYAVAVAVYDTGMSQTMGDG